MCQGGGLKGFTHSRNAKKFRVSGHQSRSRKFIMLLQDPGVTRQELGGQERLEF